MTNGGRARPWSAIRNDLGEDEGVPIEGDDVDLSSAGARVALQDAKATRAQMGRGELLAEPAESAAAIVKRGRKGLRRSRCAVCGHATATLRSPWDALLLELG